MSAFPRSKGAYIGKKKNGDKIELCLGNAKACAQATGDEVWIRLNELMAVLMLVSMTHGRMLLCAGKDRARHQSLPKQQQKGQEAGGLCHTRRNDLRGSEEVQPA